MIDDLSAAVYAGYLVDDPDEPLVFLQVREWRVANNGLVMPIVLEDDAVLAGLIDRDTLAEAQVAVAATSLFCIVQPGEDREPFIAAARAKLTDERDES